MLEQRAEVQPQHTVSYLRCCEGASAKPLQPCSTAGTCTTQNRWKLTLQVGKGRLDRQWHKCDSHGGVLPLGNKLTSWAQKNCIVSHGSNCILVYLGYSLFFFFFFFAPLSPDYGLHILCAPGKFVMNFQRVSGALLGLRSHTVTWKKKKLCGGGKVFRKNFAALMKGTTGVKMFGGPVFLSNTLAFLSFSSLPADTRKTAKANTTHGKWSVNPKQKRFSFISCFLLSKIKLFYDSVFISALCIETR